MASVHPKKSNTKMNDDPFITAIIVSFSVFAIIGSGMFLGSAIPEHGYVTKGRNDGIVFCSENPDKCKIEYTYLKLKKTQNEQ